MDLPDNLRLAVSIAIYACAYAAGIGAFALMAKRRGMATDGIAVLATAAMLGGVAGAQITQLLFGGVPGKSLLGGVAVGFAAVLYAKERLGIRRSTGDLFAVGLAAGEALGRIGCFFAGCCYGKAATVAWAVYQHDAWRHPTQLYSSFAAVCTLLVLVALERRKTLPEGALIYVQLMLLSSTRFVIEFWREGTVAALGLTTVQAVCIAGFAFCAWRLATMLRERTPAASVPAIA